MSADLNVEHGQQDTVIEPFSPQCSPTSVEFSVVPPNALDDGVATTLALDASDPYLVHTESIIRDQEDMLEALNDILRQPEELADPKKIEELHEMDTSSEYYSVTENHQSILVSFSSRSMLNGTVCERSRLLRIKFYGSFDKPLGRYLQDDLFGQVTVFFQCHIDILAVTC